MTTGHGQPMAWEHPFAWPEGATGFIIHNRMTDTVYFGPFTNWDDYFAWLDEHPDVYGGLHFAYLDVDWNR